MGDKTCRRAGQCAALGAVALVTALLVAPLPAGRLGAWQGQLLDFGHVPLFAALVLALRAGTGPPLRRAVLAAVALAGLAELVQPFVGRTGDWLDFLRGVLGAFAAAAAVRAWEFRRTRLRAFAYSVLAVALTVWPVLEVVPYAADTAEGFRTFPVLATFSTDYEFRRWECGQAALVRNADGGAQVDFLTGADPYSWIALRPCTGHFGGHRWLCYEFQVTGAPLDLATSVRTGTGAPDRTTHTDVGQQYTAGTHTARLDLGQMAARGRPERLDLSDVRAVILFVVRPRAPRTVVLTRVWLEP